MERKVGRNEIYSTDFDQRGLAAPGVVPPCAESHPNHCSKHTGACGTGAGSTGKVTQRKASYLKEQKAEGS